MNPRTVLVIVGAFVAGMVLVAVAVPRRAPAPAATPEPKLTLPTASPAPPTDDPRVFALPVSAGCAVAPNDAYLVSAGGGIAHWDGQTWAIVDETLRHLRAVSCAPDVVVAVGDGGRVVRIDPRARTVRSDVLGDFDLLAVVALDARAAYAAGTDRAVVRFDGTWQTLGTVPDGGTWRAVAAVSPSEIWFAGDGGSVARFDGKAFTAGALLGGGDVTAMGARDRLGVRYAATADGGIYGLATAVPMTRVASVPAPVRAFLNVSLPPRFYALGDDALWLFDAVDAPPRKIDTTLACPLRAVLGTDATDVWVVGEGAAGAGLAHFDGTSWTKRGRC